MKIYTIETDTMIESIFPSMEKAQEYSEMLHYNHYIYEYEIAGTKKHAATVVLSMPVLDERTEYKMATSTATHVYGKELEVPIIYEYSWEPIDNKHENHRRKSHARQRALHAALEASGIKKETK